MKLKHLLLSLVVVLAASFCAFGQTGVAVQDTTGTTNNGTNINRFIFPNGAVLIAGKVATITGLAGNGSVVLSPNDTLNVVQFTLTSAQILALNTTPITIVPATGAGTLIQVDGITAKLVFNSIAYTGANPISFAYTNASGVLVTGTVASAFIDSASGTNYYYAPANPSATGFVPVANAPIVAFVGTANPAAGNSTIVLTIRYHTITP